MALTVKRSSSVQKDEYGDTVPGVDTSFTVPDCAVFPRSSETTEGTDRDDQGQQIGYTVYAPVDSDVRRTDVVVVDGEDCEVDGRPGKYRNPFFAEPNSDVLEIKLLFTEGR